METYVELHERQLAEARKIAERHGKAAASWVFDGNTKDATYRYFLKGIDDGDPEVMESVRTPDLGGEWSDAYTEDMLAEDVQTEECRLQGHNMRDHADWDEIANAYLETVSMAFWAELERVCHYYLDD